MTPDPYPDLSDAASGLDGGRPREQLELSEADSQLLAALSQPGPPVVTAVEDQPRTGPGVEDDTAAPLPAPLGRGLLTPVFQEPTG